MMALLVLSGIFGVYAVADTSELEKATGADRLTEEYGRDIDFSRVFSVITDSLKTNLKAISKWLFVTLSVLLVLSAVNSYCEGGTKLAMDYSGVLIVSAIIFGGFSSVFTFAGQSIESQCRYMTAFLPVAASLYMAGGNISAGVASSSALLTFLSVAGNFSSSVLFPLLKGGFVLSLSSALPNSNPLQSVTTFLKSSLTTLLAFVFSIFGMVMYLQTVITASADSFAFRTVKFAGGAFIPVIGNMLGDAARTVTASAGVVRGTVGGAGIIALLCITLPAVIYTVLFKLALLACAMAARALGLDSCSKLLYDCNSLIAVLVAIQAGISVMFVIAVALFIRVGIN